MTCALAPQTPAEKRAHSAAIPASLTPVESIRRTASAVERRKPRPARPTIRENSPENTSCERSRLASARVERTAGRTPR